MATASAGRAARSCREAPARPRALAARPPRGLRAGQGRSQAQGQTTRSCARKRGSRHDKPPFRNRRTENRRRTYRSIPRRAAPPLLSRHRVRARRRQNPNRSRYVQGDRHDPRALPRARTTAVSNPVSISNSGPRSPSSRLDPNARANRRHPRARSQAADRRRSSRGYLARPPGDRLVITAPRKVLQTGSHDRAPLGPRDGEAFGPRSRTARLHDRLVTTADNRRSHSLNSSRFLFAPSSLSLRSEGERDGYR
jgi:hypothetical protein